jgi:SAM-dependent methyltransferase
MSPLLSLNAWLRFDAIRAAVRVARPGSILEVGAGQGGMGLWLSRGSRYTGFEPDDRSRRTAVARIGGRGSMVAFLPDCTVDMVCAFEVLEHLEDDRAALAAWRDRLGEGGWLVLSVPAHRRRFGPCDEHVGHFRRYDRDDIEKLVASQGFEIVSISSYGTGLGHVLEHARNVISRRQSHDATMRERSAGSGRFLQAGDRTAPVLAVIAAPFRLLQRPFASTSLGVGWVVAARRR